MRKTRIPCEQTHACLATGLLMALDSSNPIIINPHAINDDNAATSPDAFRLLPPLLHLIRPLGFRLTVRKTARSAFGTHDEDDLVAEPCLESSDDVAIVSSH